MRMARKRSGPGPRAGLPFRDIWTGTGIPKDMTASSRILGILNDYCGWRQHAMVSYPVEDHPFVDSDYIINSPLSYAQDLESNDDKPCTDIDSYRKLRAVPTVSWGSNHIPKLLKAHVPFVIRGSRLISTDETKASIKNGGIMPRWGPDHIHKLFGDRLLDVYESQKRYFRYWKADAHTGPYEFKEPTVRRQMKLKDFFTEVAKRMNKMGQSLSHNPEEEVKAKSGNKTQKGGDSTFLYLQESLSGHPEMAEEFATWNWPWLLDIVHTHKWGPPDRNIILMGMKGATTPAHYDEQENIFCQMRGRKEVYLWHPSDWRGMYPFPVNHACDRQAMVNPDAPDLVRFPKFRHTRPHYALLQAGDLLYLPVGWWHHFRIYEHLSVSITFWSKQPKIKLEELTLPLTERQLINVRRNLEEMVMRNSGPRSLLDLNKALNTMDKSSNSGKAVDPRKSRSKTPEGVLEFMVRCLCNFLPREQARIYVKEMLEGRYEDDCGSWVQPKGENMSGW